jgi:hypothetical protein
MQAKRCLTITVKKKAKHEHTFYIVESYIDNDNFPFTFMEYTYGVSLFFSTRDIHEYKVPSKYTGNFLKVL